MNPTKKGWLKDFLDYRKQYFIKNQEFKKRKMGQDPDHSFYGIVQPTGLMYGYPVNLPSEIDSAQWDNQDRVKVLLVNSLINVAELYSNKKVETADEFYQLMLEAVQEMNRYYEKVFPELSINTKSWFGKKKEVLPLAESILSKRVETTFTSKSNFWLRFFFRSQLFLDVYIFGQWTHTEPDEVLEGFFKNEKEELSFNALKVMAAAAHANKTIEEEERNLFNIFIESAGVSGDKKRVAREYLQHGLEIQDIPLDETDPWVIRKFFLELALLTAWSDKKVEEVELEFLRELNRSLGFSEDDLEKSMMAVEGFILENWSHLDELQNKKDYEQVSNEFINHLKSVTSKYQKRLLNEMNKDVELCKLLKKGSVKELNDDEKHIVETKLINVLRNLPVFSVIALPKNFLYYEHVIRAIPKEVMSEIVSD
ncbi:MAG: hypothetical protein R3345_04670 [Fulvivirga sp.]|nr:hypothetical protein [Fulvivirga sp.]